MSRLRELVTRELIVADCLRSAVCAIRLGLHARDRARGGLSEPPAIWYGRAEASLRFALAELSYLTGPAPTPSLEAIPVRLRPAHLTTTQWRRFGN